jgi:polyvinyl alcohol dehydrogenase (cytochrome)
LFPKPPAEAKQTLDSAIEQAAQAITEGRDAEILAADQKSGLVYALDPDQKGKTLWQALVGKGGDNGGVQSGMTSDEKNIYASVSDAVKNRLVTAAKVGGADFDPIQGGGLTALQLKDGGKAWFASSYACTPPRPAAAPLSQLR